MKKSQWMAIALPLVGAMLMPGSQAQTQTAEITSLAHVSLRASDMDREVEFLGKLGFEKSFANISDGKIAQVFVKVNDRQFIEVYPQAEPSKPLGWMHACYESGALNQLNAEYAAHGLKPTPVQTAAAGNLLFSLFDPDGREIEFTQYMPGSRHVLDRGEHLGDRRVSEQLLGIEIPVKDIKVAQKFYESLGFDAQKDGANVRLSIPANPDLRIELHPAHPSDQPQFLFAIDDARRATEELRSAGLKPVRREKLVFVSDPDGNSFVFMETVKSSPHRSINVIPWHRKADQ